MTAQISDTYEAAWHILTGAVFIKAAKHTSQISNKEGFRFHWIITLDNVSDDSLKLWRNGTAQGNIRDYANARRKLKRKISSSLYPPPKPSSFIPMYIRGKLTKPKTERKSIPSDTETWQNLE